MAKEYAFGFLKLWRPYGHRLTDFPSLEDGRRVQGYLGLGGLHQRTIIKDGVIIRETETMFDTECIRIFVEFSIDGRKVKETLVRQIGKDRPWERENGSLELYSVNLIRENMTMANKLMALVRLNKDQRKLTKAGVYDENGNLTADGQEVLLNLIAKDYEAKLVALVKDWKDVKKDKDSE